MAWIMYLSVEDPLVQVDNGLVAHLHQGRAQDSLIGPGKERGWGRWGD